MALPMIRTSIKCRCSRESLLDGLNARKYQKHSKLKFKLRAVTVIFFDCRTSRVVEIVNENRLYDHKWYSISSTVGNQIYGTLYWQAYITSVLYCGITLYTFINWLRNWLWIQIGKFTTKWPLLLLYFKCIVYIYCETSNRFFFFIIYWINITL